MLELEGLRVAFERRGWSKGGDRRVVAIDGIDLTIEQGENLGIVGESGSGKSTLARAVVGLVNPTAGVIRFGGEDVTNAAGPRLRELRRRVQMVFQDPYGSVNPRLKVGAVVAEPLENYHADWSRARRREAVADLLDRVQLDPEMANRSVASLSGGQLQRVGIARALALGPRLLVADEPVSALDVSVQAQILNLFADLKRTEQITFLFITHNLAVAQYITDRIAVVYAGRIVELGASEDVIGAPQHPYTKALLAAAPNFERRGQRRRAASSGALPHPEPGGCAYRTRCPLATEICTTTAPALEPSSEAHGVACHAVATWSGRIRR